MHILCIEYLSCKKFGWLRDSVHNLVQISINFNSVNWLKFSGYSPQRTYVTKVSKQWTITCNGFIFLMDIISKVNVSTDCALWWCSWFRKHLSHYRHHILRHRAQDKFSSHTASAPHPEALTAPAEWPLSRVLPPPAGAGDVCTAVMRCSTTVDDLKLPAVGPPNANGSFNSLAGYIDDIFALCK